MIVALYGLILLTPLLVLISRLYRYSKWSLLLAALPPTAASLLLPSDQSMVLGWFMLGSHLGIDATTQWLLPASAIIWSGAALHHAISNSGTPLAPRFRLFFLLAFNGNLLLLLAQDALTFYVGYALMGLAGYGLIVGSRSVTASIASGVYLRWTIAGELLLFSGLVSLAHDLGSTLLPLGEGSPLSSWTLAPLILGFGIKIGLPGLHAWMAGTYSASPTEGSAVFSGAMANAGILGLLHFLPVGQEGYASAGTWLLVYGLVAVFYGVLLGLPQRSPKVILAYSSLSQLGTLASMIGLSLMEPSLAPALSLAITVYAVHHGLTKAALFLSLDSLPFARFRGLSFAVLILLSLMMAGLPFTNGAVAKSAIKDAVGKDYDWLIILLTMASVATTLLMTRFLIVCLKSRRTSKATIPWAGAAIAILLLTWAHAEVYQMHPLPAFNLDAIWPLVIALSIAAVYTRLPSEAHRIAQPAIPKGDLPYLIGIATQRLVGAHLDGLFLKLRRKAQLLLSSLSYQLGSTLSQKAVAGSNERKINSRGHHNESI